MGPFRGDENRNDYNSKTRKLTVNPSKEETQQIDSQFSPGGDSGDDDFLYLSNTMPVDDTYQLEDEFETQLVNLAEGTQMVDLDVETQVMDFAGETQVMDFAGETQVVDLAGETQVLDDLDCTKSLDIEFFNELNGEVCPDSEDEEADRTDIICETQELSQNDSLKNVDSESVGLRSTTDKVSSREGSVCRGFTSLHAASVRASGLAANARRNSASFCTSNDKASIDKETREQDGSSVEHSLKSDRKNNLDNSEKLRNSNKCKVGSRAVRQLFRDDEDAKVSDSETEINRTNGNLDVPEQHASKHCLAGLSYASSQEPGELSQAHALEVVDKFLDLNFKDCDKSFGRRICKLEKTKVVSGAKGSRDLAKSSTLKSTVGDCGIYVWDDSREDEGGGEILLKKKEHFFPKGGPKQRCCTKPKKNKNSCVGNVKTVGDCVDKEERKFTKNKIGDPVHSDSGVHKLISNGKSLHCGEEGLQKNLMKSFDTVSGHNLAEEDSDKNVPDMRNIGPDTQMAAEAMENLCFEVHLADRNNNGSNNGVHSIEKAAFGKKLRNRTVYSEENLSSCEPNPDSVGVLTRQAKRTKRISTSNELPLSPIQRRKTSKKRDRVADVNVSTDHRPETTGRRSEEKHEAEDQLYFCVPVAHRTRKSTVVNRSKVSANSLDARDEINNVTSIRGCGETTAAIEETVTIEKARKVGSTEFKQSNKTRVDTYGASNIDGVDTYGASNIDAVDGLRGRRSRHSERLNRSSGVAANIPVNPDRDLLNTLSTCEDHALPCLDPQSKNKTSHQTVKTKSSGNDAVQCDSDHLKAKAIQDDAVGQESSPRHRTSSSTCATPANCTTPKANVSPICMGDEYHKPSSISSSLRLSLLKEIADLATVSPGPYGGIRESRKRKDITSIRVLFSQHLDVDVVKKQKKILARLGGAVASSMLEATHFVADEFVRTRNMLEAIAFGKPVVTHLWIESCEQASCLIDEKNYILRDAKKEKEFGFSLPVSLARACHHPLLQGLKVLVTPNTKPGKDIIANLVKAVQGLVVDRLGRSVLKNKKLPDDLLILSCEEDHMTCVPFLEKGGSIYSSELLLNGIVTQKLEYERHRLFVDDVKRTRSTIWVKKNNKFLLVTK